jgi:hypothetical protein
MGYADLGCMGATDIKTPNIDLLATQGVKFSDFYANAPVCSPTRCGFITGRWQQRVGFEWALGYTAERRRLIDGQWKSVDGISWSRVIPQDPYFSPRGGIGGSVFELNEKIFVVGGFNYEGEVLDERRIWGDVWSGAEGLTSWQMLGSIPNPLSYSSVAVWDERIWIVGGYTPLGGNSNEISFSDDGANWSTLSCSPIMPTHAATIWATPKGLIIGPGNEFQSAIWIIEKDDD